MALSKYSTALQVIQRAMATTGLVYPQAAAGAQDPTISRFWYLLGESGQALMKMRSWQQLQRVWTFTTDPSTGVYTPPNDFDSIADMTWWNRTGRLPMLGPIPGQGWQMLQAIMMGSGTIRLMFRFWQGNLEIYMPSSALASPQNLAIEYNSRGWVQSATNPAVNLDMPQQDGDLCLFDSQLLVFKLVLDWKKSKGFDTQAAAEDFNEAYDDVVSRDKPARDLVLSGLAVFPYIGYPNLPVTGYGLGP